jgi:hypothetical protein
MSMSKADKREEKIRQNTKNVSLEDLSGSSVDMANWNLVVNIP